MIKNKLKLSKLMPDSGKLLLTGTGKDFVARVGEQLIRNAVLGVLCGENLREQTEHLTRSRISQLSVAMLALYFRGKLDEPDFSNKLLEISSEQLKAARRASTTDIWPAMWFLGLTVKSMQNVLKDKHEMLDDYLIKFEKVQSLAISKAENDFGKLSGKLKLIKDGGTEDAIELNWRDLLQLMTAIGAKTLTLRGSDKSLYGKLFEKLVLGSVLSILGYKRVDRPESIDEAKAIGAFWLSDGSGNRESDATLLYKQAAQVRFDIGFIGPGNPEISKDKMSRFSIEPGIAKARTYTKTFIIVDRLNKTDRTLAQAAKTEAEIIQMSMRYWPRSLAEALSKVTNQDYDIASITDEKMRQFLEKKLAQIPLLDFLDSVRVDDLNDDISINQDDK